MRIAVRFGCDAISPYGLPWAIIYLTHPPPPVGVWLRGGVPPDMLEFAARDLLDLSYHVGLLLGALRRFGQEPNELGRGIGQSISTLPGTCNRLDLPVTGSLLGDLLVEAFSGMTDDAKAEAWRNLQATGELRINNANFSAERMVQHVEMVYKSLRVELSRLMLRVVPKERASYCAPDWLVDSRIYNHFPQAWQEFQAAGKCYAYGEGTACAFHLNRALEWGLKTLAVKLGKRFDRNSWETHLKDIDKELEARYGTAGPRTQEERFYSEAASQFGHLKVAWRNPTMHIEAKYDDKEALYLLTTVEKFIDHLAANGLKEPQ